jgi:transcription initiation factor TFIIE subunit alpha
MIPMGESLLYRVVSKIGGDDAVKIVSELKKRGKATEEDLAKATGIRLNEIRKILIRLHNFSLVTSESIQDSQSGWLIFYWRLQEDQLQSIIKAQKRRILEKLKARLEFEKTHDFFFCNDKHCGRYTFEEAVENFFKCPSCGGSLQHFDNSKVVEFLEKKVESLKEELEHE